MMRHTVRLSETGETFDVEPEESILDAATRAGVPMAHECTFGGCATCRVKLEEGSVYYEDFPMALTEEEHAQGFALACQARIKENVVVTPAGGQMELPDPAEMKATVVSAEPLTEHITHLTLQLPEDEDVTYVAGQHLHINLPGYGERTFSMTSAFAFGNMVELDVKRIPGGHFTETVLPQLKEGDELDVSIPHGNFYYRTEDWRPMLMIATGTGIAPIRAILESLLDDDDCPPVSLYWGMRETSDLYLKDEIESWSDRLFEFEFVPVLSRGGDAWQGRTGYVQKAIQKDFDDLSEYAFYLCGSPEMIADTKKVLFELGADPEFVYSDSFTFGALEQQAKEGVDHVAA